MRTQAALTAGLLASALLLAGCSNGAGPDAKSGAPTTTSPVPTVSVRDRFLQHINAANIESWADKGPTDDELAAYPTQWCTQLAYGHSVKDMFDLDTGGLYPIGDTWGTNISDAYRVLIIAVGDYCPKYQARVEAEARASGNY